MVTSDLIQELSVLFYLKYDYQEVSRIKISIFLYAYFSWFCLQKWGNKKTLLIKENKTVCILRNQSTKSLWNFVFNK